MAISNAHASSDSEFNHALWRRYVFAILFGNMACMFDFVILLHLSSVISTIFFPSINSPLVQNLKVIALFGVGFLSRPLGSYLIGRYGDIKGRKPALVVCLVIFTFCAFATALLPSYAQIGIFAPIILVLIRLVQGFALGSQMTLSWVFVAEHAPKNKRALFSSFATASFALANLLAYFIANVLERLMSIELLSSIGWRIPFIIGGIFSVIALILERQLSESPLFIQQLKKRIHVKKATHLIPILKQRQAIFLTSALAFVQISLVMITLVMPKIIGMNFYLEGGFLTFIYVSTLSSLVLGCVFFGWLADKVNVGIVMIGGAFALVIQSLTFYIYLPNYTNTSVLIMCSLFGFLSGIRALCPVVFVQLFPTENRLTSVSITYNCVAAVLGATLPLALLYFSNILGAAPGLYLTFIGIIIGMLGLAVQHSPELNKFENLQTSPLKPNAEGYKVV